MKIFSSLLFLLFYSSLWGETSPMTLKTEGGPITLYQKEKAWVSKDCLSTSCLALKKVILKKEKATDSPWANHPAAAFCEAHSGAYLKGTHPSGDEDGICRFKDGSLILAWDFYERNKGQK